MKRSGAVRATQVRSVRLTGPRLTLNYRDDLLDTLGMLVPSGHAYQPSVLPPQFRDLGRSLAALCDTDEPVGLLVHHDIELGWHRDRQAPPDTWNITYMVRPPTMLDYLVVDDTAYPMVDGAYVHFDNQRWHGCYRYQQGGRYAMTFYVPAP